MKTKQWFMASLLIGLAFPFHAFASTITNYEITATDTFGDVITGTITTNGQVGPLGTNASTFVNNGILQGFNLTGTGVLFGNGTTVSGTVTMNGNSTFPTNAVYYSGLGIVCALPGGSIGQCDLSNPPNFNQTIFNFNDNSNTNTSSYVAFTYWNAYPGTGLPTWTAEYSDPNTLTTNQALFTSFTSKEVLPGSSVPEPPAAPLMLLGLGLLVASAAGIARRRKAWN